MRNTKHQVSGDSRARIQASVKDEALVEKRREQICKAALQAFTENGFHETNLRQVTKLAGLAYGSIYDYVKSKDDILFLIYDSILGQLYQSLKQAVDSSDDPEEQLRAIIKAAMDHTDEYRAAINLLYQESRVVKTSGHLPVVFAKERSYLQLISEVLERGVKQGVFTVSTPAFVVNTLPLMCSAWALKGWNLKGVSKEEYTQALTRFVLQGIGAPLRAVVQESDKPSSSKREKKAVG